MIRRYNNGNNYLQHFAQGAGALVANPNVIRGAGQVGRFLGNRIREYTRGERYEGEERGNEMKRKQEDEDEMESSNVDNTEMYSSTASSNGGPRGTLTGNTVTNYSYEDYYHERSSGHSKKLKLLMLTWGMSIWGPRDRVGGTKFPLLKYGTAGVIGAKAPAGIVVLRTLSAYGNSSVNMFTPIGTNFQGYDFSECIYSNAVNFYLSDFLDNKLFSDSGTKGLFLQYRKFRLKSFTVQITPHTYHQNILQYAPNVIHSAINSNGWDSILTADEKKLFQTYKHPWYEEPGDPGYFIHRDIYNTYSGSNGSIPIIPNSAQPDSKEDDTAKREQFVIKNLDHNVTYIKSGESFSFTREVSAQGNYYFDTAGLLANLKTPIGNIVNQLEGQIAETSNIVKKNPEGFNILIVPGKCRVEMFGEINLGGTSSATAQGNGYLMLPSICTQLQIKTTAKWECFDFNYETNSFSGYMQPDPLEKAIFDYNVEKTITGAHLNRGITN